MEIVGEFDGGAAIGFVEFANEAERIERVVGARIAITKIVSEERAPASAERDASAGEPTVWVEEFAGLAKIERLGAIARSAGEVGVESEDGVDIESIGSDE